MFEAESHSANLVGQRLQGVGRGLFDKTYETFHRFVERDQLDHISFPYSVRPEQ